VCVIVAIAAYRLRDAFMDDAFIGFRYVDNLINRSGLVFNPGEHVEGITNVGWILLLAAFSKWFAPTTIAKILGVIFVLVSSLSVYSMAKRASSPDLLRITCFGAVGVAVTKIDFLFFSLVGMETALLSTLLCVLVLISWNHPCHWAIPCLCVLSFLLHPECVIIYPLFIVLSVLLQRSVWRIAVAPTLMFLTLVAAITAARLSYYGLPLPNTFYAKATALGNVARQFIAWLQADNTNIPYPFGGALALALICIGIYSVHQSQRYAAAMCVSVLGTGFAFCVYSQPDWTGLGRYFAPYIPLASVALTLGIAHTCRVVSHAAVRGLAVVPIAAVWVGILICGQLGHTGKYLFGSRLEGWPGFIMTARTLVPASKRIGDLLPHDSVIATRRIGAISYYSKLRVFDFAYGLTDRKVAKLIECDGRIISSPRSPVISERWREVAPTHILDDMSKIETYMKDGGGTLDRFEVHGMYYGEVDRFPITGDNNWVLCERLVPLIKK
jgi:hypothetical protein